MKRKNMKRNMSVAVILTLAMILQSGIIAFAGELEEIPSEGAVVMDSDAFEAAFGGLEEDPSGIVFGSNLDSGTGSEDGDTEVSEECMNTAGVGGNEANTESPNGASIGTVKNLKVTKGNRYTYKGTKHRKYNISFSKVSGASGYVILTYMPNKALCSASIWTSNKGYWVSYSKGCNGCTAYVKVYAFKKSGKKYINGPATTKSYKFKY